MIEDNRLPDFSDRENLPYVEAVYLEALRWRTTVPISESRENRPRIQPLMRSMYQLFRIVRVQVMSTMDTTFQKVRTRA